MQVEAPTIRRAATVLADGGLVAFPTETVYGLGAWAWHPDAVKRLFEVKGRPPDHPVSLLVPPLGWEALGHPFPRLARRLAQIFWPGPLTIVVPKDPAIPDVVTAQGRTVGLRCPDHPVVLALLEAVTAIMAGRDSLAPPAIATPSANRFGEPPPRDAAEVARGLGEGIDLIVDGGPCRLGVPSTVIDCSVSPPKILREGALSAEKVLASCG